MLKHSVTSRILCFIAIDLKIAATPAAVEFRSLSFIAFDRDWRDSIFPRGKASSLEMFVTHCGSWLPGEDSNLQHFG
jgi:hypothetical protein